MRPPASLDAVVKTILAFTGTQTPSVHSEAIHFTGWTIPLFEAFESRHHMLYSEIISYVLLESVPVMFSFLFFCVMYTGPD